MHTVAQCRDAVVTPPSIRGEFFRAKSFRQTVTFLLCLRTASSSQPATRQLRGPRSWQPTIDGLLWLVGNGFDLTIAGRTVWGETDATMRAGYAKLFSELGVEFDASDPQRLTLFPEMEEQAEVPEISEGCWDMRGLSPDQVMCASSRMVVKRKGAVMPVVVACSLLPYAGGFEMGSSLAGAAGSVHLNHRHCARFCVLGGASCSSHK